MLNNQHPIQLQSIRVSELSLEVRDPAIAQKEDANFPFIFLTGHSVFDPELKQIMVGVHGQIGEDAEEGDSKAPFLIKAHIIGLFSVDASKFPVDKLDNWASENAPLILLPFLREHIYGLASRAGIKEVIIPLYVVPSYKVVRPEDA
jgi:preprotein translocase subunit SecB